MSEEASQYGPPITEASADDLTRDLILKQHPLPWKDTWERGKEVRTLDANNQEVSHLTLSLLAVTFLTQQ